MAATRTLVMHGADDPTPQTAGGLFAAGFRPFFLGAGLSALVPVLYWVMTLAGAVPHSARATIQWHGHEMVFGFAGAVVAGFLLTAVPKWTKSAPVTRGALATLFLVWVAGRALMFLAATWPLSAAALDLTFIPLLTWHIARPIVRARSTHNYGFIGLLTVLAAANAMYHAFALGLTAGGETRSLSVAIYAVVVMIVIIGNRVVPGFTRPLVLQQGIERELTAKPWLARGTVAAVVVAAMTDVFWRDHAAHAAASWLAAALLLTCTAHWAPHRVWRAPIVWVLHVGFGWLAIGFMLNALAALGVLPHAVAATHAFTAGAIGTMSIGIMSRAALGHTGRRVIAAPAIVGAYVLVIVGALVRTAAQLFAAQYILLVCVAGALWAGGYSVFLAYYAPILVRPRADGQPG